MVRYFHTLCSIFHSLHALFIITLQELGRMNKQQLTHSFLALKDLDETHQFLAQYRQRITELCGAQSQADGEMGLRNLLIPLLQSSWSFAMKVSQQIVGVYLQMDAVDYLEMFKKNKGLQDQGIMKELFISAEKVGSPERGRSLVSVMSIFCGEEFKKQELNYIYLGFMFCKVIGWKYLLFPTDNPVPFIKVGAQIREECQKNNRKWYIMEIQTSKLNLFSNPFQRLARL